MAGYTRNDVSNSISNGNVADADALDGEFDALVAAFHAATGHTHDGTAANGAPILKLGPVQDVTVNDTAMFPKTTDTVNLGSNSLRWKQGWFQGNVNCAANFVGNLTGTATNATLAATATLATAATALATPRTIALSGGATASGVAFDGSANITLSVSALAAASLTGTIDDARLPSTLSPKTISTDSADAFLIRHATSSGSQGITWENNDGTNVMAVGRRSAGPQFVITDGSAVGMLANAKFSVNLSSGDITWAGSATGNMPATNLTGTIDAARLPSTSAAETWLGHLFALLQNGEGNILGSLGFFKNVSGAAAQPGDILDNSDLAWSSTNANTGAAAPGGSEWVALGNCPNNAASLWVRVI